MFYGLVCIKIF